MSVRGRRREGGLVCPYLTLTSPLPPHSSVRACVLSRTSSCVRKMESWGKKEGEEKDKSEGVYVTQEHPPAVLTDTAAPGRTAKLRWTLPAWKT
jgi:hypothetical protein